MRQRFHFSAGLAGLYLLLLIIAVPWYWPEGETRLLFGVPIWVLGAMAVGLTASALAAWVLLRYRWTDEDDRREDR